MAIGGREVLEVRVADKVASDASCCSCGRTDRFEFLIEALGEADDCEIISYCVLEGPLAAYLLLRQSTHRIS